jgi:hypothetical protein
LSAVLDGANSVIWFEALEAGPVPNSFAAVTVKVYAMPLLRLVTVQEVVPAVTQAFAPLPDTITT